MGWAHHDDGVTDADLDVSNRAVGLGDALGFDGAEGFFEEGDEGFDIFYDEVRGYGVVSFGG